MRVDKRMLVHSFEYHEFEDRDNFANPTYSDPVTINHVRIDPSKVYTNDGKQVVVVANAVIFCYAEHTEPLLDFKEKSKVVFDGREHIITRVISCSEPYSDKLWSVEIEVI